MDERLLQELAKFQQTATQIQEVIGSLQSHQPEGASGSDAQGAVEVRIGRDGLPEHISASSDWHRRRRPEALGAAVAEACEAAASELMSVWSQGLMQSDWDRKVDEVHRTTVGQPFGTASAVPDAAQRDWQRVVARPLDQLAEDVIASLTQLSSPDTRAADSGRATGTDSGRNVSITLSHGSLSSCEVDAAWAKNQSSVGLNRAFNEALTHARTALRETDTADAAAGSRQHASSLLDEAMAILSDPRRITGS